MDFIHPNEDWYVSRIYIHFLNKTIVSMINKISTVIKGKKFVSVKIAVFLLLHWQTTVEYCTLFYFDEQCTISDFKLFHWFFLVIMLILAPHPTSDWKKTFKIDLLMKCSWNLVSFLINCSKSSWLILSSCWRGSLSLVNSLPLTYKKNIIICFYT